MEHPLSQFKYCPKCGSAHFEVHNEKSKQCADCGFVYYFNPSSATVALILNERDELLVCRRAKEPAKGTLDLPGGFIDMTETGEEGVAREVREETGLQKLSIVKKLRKTYHTYRLENSTKVLKVTHWYLMMCSDNAQPIPQQEEDIEVATWIPAAEVDQKLNRAYANIRDIITSGINTMHHG